MNNLVITLSWLTGRPVVDTGPGTYDCLTSGGDRITVTGDDFQAGLTVSVNGKACTDVVQDADSVECTLPAGTGRSLHLTSLSGLSGLLGLSDEITFRFYHLY